MVSPAFIKRGHLICTDACPAPRRVALLVMVHPLACPLIVCTWNTRVCVARGRLGQHTSRVVGSAYEPTTATQGDTENTPATGSKGPRVQGFSPRVFLGFKGPRFEGLGFSPRVFQGLKSSRVQGFSPRVFQGFAGSVEGFSPRVEGSKYAKRSSICQTT